jgi:hypothetical protein
VHRQFAVRSVIVDPPAMAGHDPATMLRIIWIVVVGLGEGEALGDGVTFAVDR